MSIGKKPDEISKQLRQMRYPDKVLAGFLTYFKKIAEHEKDRINYDNAAMVKKMSKLDETNEAKLFYYHFAQVAPIEELLAARNNAIIPDIKTAEARLEILKLELQMLEVFIKRHHPESNAI